MLGEYEVWQLINLTNDTHPIHVHLDPFQILSRRPISYQIPGHGIEDLALTAAVTFERDPGDELDHTIDDNERGLKDTVRVNPSEITEIAVRFTCAGWWLRACRSSETGSGGRLAWGNGGECLGEGADVVAAVVGMQGYPDSAGAGAGVDFVLAGQRGLHLAGRGGGVPERDDV